MLDPFRLIVDARGKSRPVVAGPAPPTATAAPDPATAVGDPELRQKEAPVEVAALPQAPAEPPSAMTIVLDPGHGGKDPGATGVAGLREKDVVLRVALALRDRLVRAGHQVILTRDGDVFVPLDKRTLLANRAGAALFVSIHANASRNRAASGIETYYLSNTNDRATIRLARMENHLGYMAGGRRPSASDVSYIVSDMIQSYKIGESMQLAEEIQSAVVAQAALRHPPARDLGVKPGPFAVLVGSGMPAVLTEISFLTHPEEGRRLADAAYLDAVAEGLLRGIRAFAKSSQIATTL
jgi:N-acetylmuramoyl-L-alanine amidase